MPASYLISQQWMGKMARCWDFSAGGGENGQAQRYSRRHRREPGANRELHTHRIVQYSTNMRIGSGDIHEIQRLQYLSELTEASLRDY